MHENHLILLLGLTTWLTLIHNYTDMDYLPTATRCSPTLNLCVACPHLPRQPLTTLTQHQQIYSQSPFFILAAKRHAIVKGQCREMIELVEEDEQKGWIFVDKVRKDIKDGKVTVVGGSEVSLAQGRKYHWSVTQMVDYVVYYQRTDSKYPEIKAENSSNPERLVNIALSIGWGMAIALVCKWIDNYCGWLNPKGGYAFPALEMVLLFVMVSIASSQVTLGRYVYLLEIMYLVYLGMKLEAERFYKYRYAVVSLSLAFVLLPFLIVVGYVLLFFWFKRRHPKLRMSPSHVQTSVGFLTLIAITSILQYLASFNSFAYAAYSAKIVGIPLTLLIFQHRRPSST